MMLFPLAYEIIRGEFVFMLSFAKKVPIYCDLSASHTAESVYHKY